VSYITLECNLYRHPKVLALGKDAAARDARGLYVGAIMYSRQALTDGVILQHVLVELDPSLGTVQAKKAADLLVSTGLLKRRKGRNGGWVIPDYGRHQQTKEEVETAREQAKVRKRKSRESQRDTHLGHSVTPSPVTEQEESRKEESPKAVTALRPDGNGPGFKIPNLREIA
jgi:hypothetical protein